MRIRDALRQEARLVGRDVRLVDGRHLVGGVVVITYEAMHPASGVIPRDRVETRVAIYREGGTGLGSFVVGVKTLAPETSEELRVRLAAGKTRAMVAKERRDTSWVQEEHDHGA